LPKKGKSSKSLIDRWIDRYNRLGENEQALVLAFVVIVVLLIFVAVIQNPIPIALGAAIALVIGFLGWILVKSKTAIAPEHILAIGAVAVAMIIAAGVVLRAIDIASGGIIIAGLVGGGAIAEVIKARRTGSKD
jgi:predicted neutral ceramidase superfamily lipid hydrolase